MSQTEHMGVSPSRVSCHTKGYSSPKQTTPKQTPCTECIHGGISENKGQLSSEVIQTTSGDTNTVVSHYGACTSLQPSLEDVTRRSLAEDFDLAPSDPCDSSLTDKGGLSKEKDQDGSEIVQNGTRQIGTSLSSDINNKTKTLQPSSEDLSSCPEDLRLPPENTTKSMHIAKSYFPQKTTLGRELEFAYDSTRCEPSEEIQKPSSKLVQTESVDIRTFSCCNAIEHLEPQHDTVIRSSIKPLNQPPDDQIKTHAAGILGAPQDDMDKLSNLEHWETPSKNVVKNSNRSRRRVKRTPKSRKKNMLRGLIGTDRVLRSRSGEKPKASESNTNSSNVNSSREKQKKRRKKRGEKRVVVNEHSRIRTHLRYLLNRMNYEQSLIIAYSGEGWKGLSLEKLKPEKELQRAKSEIFRCKLRIRDLFQRIDSLCAEGRLPASLFDSEGQISSEDIFCATCGSKELTADNDIILCDGTCERGFHQFCLATPLLKEDIPPDDEGWLCPGCDCKVDCIDLLNESQGANLSITDSWEKVFPEAAAATAGQNFDNNYGLPSDDSDDNDYDPEGQRSDEKSEGEESSSDESDFTSASDDMVVPPVDDQYAGLPSDDSEDGDYNPDAAEPDEKLKEESSSSDFTSDSEDLAATLVNNESEGEEKSPVSIGTDEGSNGRRYKFGGKKKQSLRSELSSLMESDPSQDVSVPISGKRNLERLDYKKLYDETYGNVSSDSSDDEDFTDMVGPRKRRRKTEGASVSENEIAIKQDLKETKHTPKRTHRKLNSEDKNKVPAKAQEGSSPSSSGGKKVRSSAYRRLGEAITQRLYKSFQENQYPDRATKESLAEDLGITFHQVSKWFENARWSYNHSSSMDEMMDKRNQEKNSSVPKAKETTGESGPEMVSSSTTGNTAQIEQLPEAAAATVAVSYASNARTHEIVFGIPNKHRLESMKQKGPLF